jgi:2'-hydroxyisoflavone reductase
MIAVQDFCQFPPVPVGARASGPFFLCYTEAMRLLILGGTVFLGRALTDVALARGHRVTHVHRGRSRPSDPRVETLLRDREEVPFLRDVDPARAWDAVVDTSGYLPQVVARSVEALRDRVAVYAFVSSISAYASFEAPGFDEGAPLQPDPDPLPDKMTPELYGALKAACERVVLRGYGERALLVRPGLIVGPHDPSDRFTYWPWRIAQGGRFVAPGRPGRPIQFIDARDIADWTIAMLESSRGGTFQVNGPDRPLTMAELVEGCRAVACNDSSPVWISDEALLEREVRPWSEIPLWIPEGDAEHRGFMAASLDRALAHGLKIRSLGETIADTLRWARERPASHEWKAGLSREREAALLDHIWRK